MGKPCENDVVLRQTTLFIDFCRRLTSKESNYVIRPDAADMMFFEEFRLSHGKLTIFDDFWRILTIFENLKIFQKSLVEFRHKLTIIEFNDVDGRRILSKLKQLNLNGIFLCY